MFRRCVLGLMIAAILGAVPFSTAVHARSCDDELARQDAALRQLEVDARRESVEFALDDARRAALAEVNKRLKGDATAEAAKEIKARWDEYQGYVAQARTLEAKLQDLARCLEGGRGQCLVQFLRRDPEEVRLSDRIDEAFRKWIASLGNEAISRAAARVERARSILQNFTNRAAGTATEAASRGIDSCLRDFDQRVQRTQNTNTPVGAGQPPPPPGAVAAPRKGGAGGKLLLGGAAAAAVALGGVYAKSVIDSANESAGGGPSSGPSQSSDPSQIRLMNNPAIQCTRTGGAGSVCRTTTDIIIDVGNVFTTGTQVCILTEPTAFPDCRTKTSSSQILFRIEQSIVNVNVLTGNIECRPTQTGIFVYKDTYTGVQPTTRLAANMTVSCN
ncbi:MAG: hypothetical protein K2Y23_16855 [Cyanobacteria bacterium]|nr:hypothetical protein [Cyanobacteriota bacterium]